MKRCYLGVLFFILLIVTSMGCAVFKSLNSPYRDFHETFFETVRVPEKLEFEQAVELSKRSRRVFEASIGEVWEACLKVVMQYDGILALETEPTSRRLVFSRAHQQDFKLSALYLGTPRKVRHRAERLIGVHLYGNTEGKTIIDAAWISPTTGKAEPLGTDFFLESGRGADDEVWSLADRVVTDFFYHIDQVLVPEEKFLQKFFSGEPSSPPRGVVPGRKYGRDIEDAVYRTGNYQSTVRRLGSVVIAYPRLEVLLKKVTEKLCLAAGEDTPRGDIFIIASREANAHITSNGDIFVTTGLLEATERVDELAGLLGHELSHFFHGDYGKLSNADQLGFGLGLTLAGGVSIGSLVAQLWFGREQEDQEPLPGLLSTEEVLIGATFGLAAYYAAIIMGEKGSRKISDAVLGRYSLKQELRADLDASEYLWYAGYDHRALLNFFKRQQERGFTAKD